MSTYNVDTEGLRQANSDINSYINDINTILNNTIKRIEKMPRETKEWQGNSADDFAQIALEQKELEFNPIIQRLQQFSNELKKIADDFDNVERNTRL